MSLCQRRNGFTLIELLVATTIFVSLMGLVTVAFNRISSGGKKGLQVLELHTKADAVLRYMEMDLRNIPNVAAMHLKPATASEPGTFTFMRQVNDTHPSFTNKGSTVPDYNPFEAAHGQRYRLTDLIWVRWQWESGIFGRGQSRINQRYDDSRQWKYQGTGLKRYTTASRRWIREVILDRSYPLGIQTNSIPPMLQRHYDFFEGDGSVSTIDGTTGESSAGAGGKVQVYKVVGGTWSIGGGNYHSEFFDLRTSPWRTISKEHQGGDLRHQYTTLDCGNKDPLSDSNAYAVRNVDGNSVNKDRLNLVGADDADVNGEKIYPNQIHDLFNGVEYLEIELVKRNGRVLKEGDDTNRLSDAGSLDVSGVDPATGDGISGRPTHVRISYLLHTIPQRLLDELDFDQDGDASETLMQAIGDMVDVEGHATQLEKVAAYKKHALKHGHTGLYFTQSVQLGY